MILDDFIILTNKGLYCSYGNFYLDPCEAVHAAVISHAHADHAVRGNAVVYCTPATAAFMTHRYKKLAAAEFKTFGFQEPFTISEVKITFVPAGHMLGSAQVLMEYKGIRYLYSGDYKLCPDASCEPFVVAGADVLITETTFANPSTIHPAAAEEVKKLSTRTENIMLGAYALGKSQRMIRLISDHCPEKEIMLHHSIVPFTRIYEENGMKLGRYKPYDRKVMKQNLQNQVYIVPPMVFNSYFRAVNVIRVFVTGWKHLQNQQELQLYISDHVDWQDILETIEKVDPKEVWTLHGDGKHLKAHFGERLKVKILN